MLQFVQKYRNDVNSQNGEDGIIAECLKRMKLHIGIAVEFGGADGIWFSNTHKLRSVGWKVYQYDLKAMPLVEEKEITPENVNELPPCNVLSIDIDGNDYNVWKAFTGNPDLVIIEINSSFYPELDWPLSVKEDLHGQTGTCYTPMVKLGVSKDYFLVCHTGNLIFVKNQYRELFPEVVGDGLVNWQDYFNTSWLK